MRISNNAEDTLIEELIISARERLEGFIGVNFGVKTMKCRWDYLQDWAELPYQPNAVVDTVVDDDGATIIHEEKGLEYIKIYAVGANGINVTYDSGYEVLPKALKEAILKEVSTSYENRENYVIGEGATQLSNGAKMLAQRYKRNSFFGIL